ncbi:MAG: signal peptidase II [Planctomycetota bacterium JB042]
MSAAKLVPFVLLATVVTALDLWSKHVVWERLPVEHQRIVVLEDGSGGDPTFELVHHRNQGGMWGVGQSWNPWILRIVRLGAVLVIFVILAQTPASDRWSVGALGFVMGGAVGNIHDSLRYGHVRDFLKFDFDVPVLDPFPTFNVADSAICVGVFLLAWRMIFHPIPEPSGGGGENGGGKQEEAAAADR